MENTEALCRAISQQLAAAVAINTKHGDIPLDDETRAALDNALRPIYKRRLNAILAGTAAKE